MFTYADMNEILVQFTEAHIKEPGQCNSIKFINAFRELNHNFSKLHHPYFTHVNAKIFRLLKLTLNILKYVQHSDSVDPLSSGVFIDYMQMCSLIVRIKYVIIHNYPQGDEIYKVFLKNYTIEQQITRNYKSKFGAYLLTITDNNELSIIIKSFSTFLIDYILYLEIIKENELLKQNFTLLLEVGDFKLLFDNIDNYVFIIPSELQFDFVQKLAYHLNDVSYDINISKFFVTMNKDTRSEACSLTYYIFKHMLKSIPHENWTQTLNIFDKFPIKSILSVLESESTINNLCEEAVELFFFQKYDKLMPLKMVDQKINKYIDALKSLASSSGDHKICNYRCIFALISISLLYDFAVNTDIPCSSLVPLIQLIIEYLKTCKLPPNLKAASIIFDVYQRAKCSDESLALMKPLCRAITKSFKPHIIPDLLEVLDNDDKMSDRLIITANFLLDQSGCSMIKNAHLQPLLYTLNEKVIYLTHQWFANKQWILPYSISLHISLLMAKRDSVCNNLAVLRSYLFILLDSNQVIDLDDKKYFFTKLIMHYNRIIGLLPNDFLLICWNNIVTPQNLGIKAAKRVLSLCSSKKLKVIIRMLKQETMRIMDLQDASTDDNYYLFLINLWSCLLNMKYVNNKRDVLRSSVNDFVSDLRRKYIFDKKNLPTVKLMFLMKLLTLMLKRHWINKIEAITSSLQVITYVEHGSHITEKVLAETAKLLINMYKCQKYALQPFLEVYLISFASMVKKCWALATVKHRLLILYNDDKNLLKPFYKFEKCSRLFKNNAQDFENVSQYLSCHLIELLLNLRLPPKFKKCYLNIIYNLMDLCSDVEMTELLASVEHPEHNEWMTRTYNNYRNNRFIGV